MLIIYKKLGQTPLEALNILKKEKPEYKDLPLSYAGRLDPMAEGFFLVLIGPELKDKEKYLKLDKEYEFEILFGFETDTGDLLGLVTNLGDLPNYNLETALRNCLPKFLGKFRQAYPAYSSKTVLGKPLWLWARENKLALIKRPEKEIEIYSIDLLAVREIQKKELLKNIIEKVSKVKGDFRQAEILKKWTEILESSQNEFILAKIKVFCSSGTYIRSLAQRISSRLGLLGCVFSIKRTKIAGLS